MGDITIDDHDPEDEEIDPATTDWTERRDLAGDAAYFLRKEAQREWARGTLSDTVETAGAHYKQSRILEGRVEDLEQNAFSASDITAEDRAVLRDVAPALVDEIIRRETEAAAEQAERERREAMTEEQKQAEAKAEAEFAALQKREDDLEDLVHQTRMALTEPEAPPVSVLMIDDPDSTVRQATVTTGTGDEATSHAGLGPAVRYEGAYKRAVKQRVGLFGIKDLADEVTSLPPGARAGFWAERTQLEKDALERAFGIRPAVSDQELKQAMEGGV